jgi:YD repeat-containing protein
MKSYTWIAVFVLCSMVAPGLIFPGLGLSSARGQSCPNCPQNSPDLSPPTFPSLTFNSPEPVSFSTGAFVFSCTDLKEPGVMPIVFTRYYNSTIGYAGPLGNNWDFSFNRYLSFAAGVTYYHTGQGTAIPLYYPQIAQSTNGNGGPAGLYGLTVLGEGILAKSTGRDVYVLTSSTPSEFVITEGGTPEAVHSIYIVTDKYGNRDIFDANGFLVESIDKNGNQLSYTRDTNGNLLSIQDPVHGQSLTITLDSHYHISAITDSAARTVSYAYDSNYNLTGVTLPETTDFPDGVTDNYTYDSDQRMITKVDALGAC